MSERVAHAPNTHPEEWEGKKYIGNDGYTMHLDAGGAFEMFFARKDVTPEEVDAMYDRLLDSEEHAVDSAIPQVAEDAAELLKRMSDEIKELKKHKQHLIEVARSVKQFQKSVQVKHWDAYHIEGTVHTHQFDIEDQRNTSGQAYVTVGAIEGGLDDMLSVTMEVNTNPLTGIEHVPCAHVHFDESNMAFSLFKIGNRILMRPETGVEIACEQSKPRGVAETVYWFN